MKLKGLIIGVMLSGAASVHAQNDDQIQAYVSNFKEVAIAEMQRSGIPASIILAQGIHETEAGTSELVLHSNNHFGIKCKTGWTGATVFHDDDARGECFRSYATAEDSYRDHSDFLSASPRYAFLFRLNPEDYQSWAYGLKKAGYATNPRYPQILIKLIEDYNLEQYTLVAMGKIHRDDPVAVNQVTTDRSKKTLDGFTDSSGLLQPLTSTVYPEGAFQINSARVVFAKAGVSLLSLSNEYNVPLARLLDFNDMNQQDILPNDQLVFLQRKRKMGANPVHIVQPGESLYIICQTEGIRYESILELNQMRVGEEPAPGEKIFLQSAATARPALRNLGYKKPAIPAS